ncbi:MAG: ACT domain-containing protein [Oscillospiraceae bacterium]|nr:ACT domain-containing protein [Oscillospiraceae bacterium]
MKAVITVIGRDTVGVIARVSAVCADLNINIEDVTQSILQDMFCMIMLVDTTRCSAAPAEVRARFEALGQEMKMQVTLTRQEVFDAMHKI